MVSNKSTTTPTPSLRTKKFSQDENRPVVAFPRIRPFLLPTAIVLAIYFIAMLSIWRADVSFIDDMNRSISGYAWNDSFNRYSASWLSYILNFNFILSDISPFPQIIAMFFLALTGVILTYILCGRKIKYLPLIISALIGLSPLCLQNWLYKFDAPTMSLPILLSVIPFLLWPNNKAFESTEKPKLISTKSSTVNTREWVKFGVVSFICLLVMWTSYQAASGIYLVMVLVMILYDLINGEKLFGITKRTLFAALPYLLSSLFFKFVLPSSTGYRDTEMFGLTDLFQGLNQNLAFFFQCLNDYTNLSWKILFIATCLCFITSLVLYSNKSGIGKILEPIFGVVFVVIALPASYGAYLLLTTPPGSGSSFMGIGFVMAVCGILATRNIGGLKSRKWHAALAVPGLAYLYAFIAFTLSFGNGLADNVRYYDFRSEMLLTDLSSLYPEKNSVALQIQGTSNHSPVMEHVISQYPIAKIIAAGASGLSQEGYFGDFRMVYYDRYWQLEAKAYSDPWNQEDFSVVQDTYYHTIMEDTNKRVLVVLKDVSRV